MMRNTISYYKAELSQIWYCIFLLGFFIPAICSAQTRGKVEVVKDPLIDTLIARRSSLNKNNIVGEETSNGYRVQIFFGSNRQAAYNAQAKFMNEYPEIHTYISYNEPNFKVHVGDFRTRLEAQKLENELTGMFPSLFIIPERVNTPKPDASND
jgi:hypothetical protein